MFFISPVHKKMETVQIKQNSKDVLVSEIESHEAQSKQWWDPRGTMRALHTLNKLRLPLIKKGLVATKRIDEHQAARPMFLEGVKVLDVGCGGGILCEALAKAGGNVTGVDPSDVLISVAQHHAEALDVKPPLYLCDTIENHSDKLPGYYDVVVASEVIEHVPNQETFLTACVAALKPGGSLFITTPNRTFLSWLGVIFFCEDVLRMVPRGFHSWSQFIHLTTLKAMINRLNCRVNKEKGMVYNPFSNRWRWFFSTAFIYAVHSVKSC